ncbi:MAG TPA: hypothetical protein GXZ59_04555 [Clostridiaceae bacterium]|nr:hypothetical protein [Clostridiaceae bacterium]
MGNSSKVQAGNSSKVWVDKVSGILVDNAPVARIGKAPSVRAGEVASARAGKAANVRVSKVPGIRAGRFLLSVVLLLLLFSNLLTACSPALSSQETNPTVHVSTQSYKELPAPSANNQPGRGTLRLWWQKPESYNPLLPATVPQKGIFSLLYQPLFTLSDTGFLEGVIAEDYLWSQDRLTLKVIIRQDIYFNDGSPLEVEDVRSSIFSWKNNQGWLTIDPEDTENKGVDVNSTTQNGIGDSSEGTAPATEEQNSLEHDNDQPDSAIDAGEETTSDQSEEGMPGNEGDAGNTGDTGRGDESDAGEGSAPDQADISDANTSNQDGEGNEDDDRGVPESETEGEAGPHWSSWEETIDVSELVFLPRKEAIQSISEIAAVEDGIEIHLSARCDNLPDYLNVPIIPSENTQGILWELPPGTGDWYCEDFSITGELKLARTGESDDLTVIVNVYDSSKAAMQSFVRGEIDLLLLSASSWPRYGGVRDIRSRKLPNGQFAYLQLHTESGPLSSQDYYNAVIKAFLRSNLTTDMPAGTWLYSPMPEKGVHPFLPRISAVREKLDELTAGTSLAILKQKPTIPLLFTWPELDYAAIVGEQIRRELRMRDIPVVREGESLMPEVQAEPTLMPTTVATATPTPTPTPDPNVIVLPEETTGTATEASATDAYDPAEVPTTTAMELVISSGDNSEPYLFYRQLLGTTAEDESLALLKEAYWKRLRIESSATMKGNPDTEYASLLAATMALLELADAGDVLGLALPSDVICFGDRIEGVAGMNCDNPYKGLEDLIIWP